MCILLVAYRCHPEHDLIVAANRDEFYARPSTPAAYWADIPGLIAGRDLSAGGTWLGVTTGGHFAAVTNLRGATAVGTISRGHLVRDFLRHQNSTESYLRTLDAQAPDISGCNLLLSDRASLHWWSHDAQRPLSPGVYGISNSPLPDEWPKVQRLKAAYDSLAALRNEELINCLFELLRDSPAARAFASSSFEPTRLEEKIFVQSPAYGTRCSTVILRSTHKLVFVERAFDERGQITTEREFVEALTRDAAIHH